MDKKYEIHKLADEIAYKDYNCGFYDLDKVQRMIVWKQAEEEFEERQRDLADYLRKEDL